MSASFVGTIEDQIDKAFARDFTVQAQGFTHRAGRRPGRPALGPEGDRGDAGDRHGRADARDAARPPGRRRAAHEQGIAIGVDPAEAAEGRRHRVPGRQPVGRPTPGSPHGGVLLGRPYANRADLERGDTLELVGPAASRDAKVVGIIDAVGPMAGMEMRMSLDTMQPRLRRLPARRARRGGAQRRTSAAALEAKIGAAPRPQLPEPRDAVRGRREAGDRRRDQPHLQHVQRDRHHRDRRQPPRRRSTRSRCR